MTKTIIKAALFACALAGLLLWINGYRDVGLGLVIGGYALYVVVRLLPKRKLAGDLEQDESQEDVKEPSAPADSWEEMRKKAVEALERRLRGQKIAVSSFFRPAHTEFPALVRVHDDLSTGAQELALKTDFEVLKLCRSAQETKNLLEEISGTVQSEDDLHREIEKLRPKTQP